MDGGVGFDEPELSWSTQDIEQKIGFSGGRYTDTNAFFTFLVGLIFSTLFFLSLHWALNDWGFKGELTQAEQDAREADYSELNEATGKEEIHLPLHILFGDKFINRGLGGYLMAAGITLLFFWAVTILFIKGRKVSFSKENPSLEPHSTGPQLLS